MKARAMNKSADRVFEKTRKCRRQLGKLVFERKIEIVIKLQRIAAEIRPDKRRQAWPI
ncbi:MAG: hypothetical protein GYA53_03750 [Acidobacteria bacterium]|nr:hypothetical protein [Acidobacteriota bacterium]